MSLQSGDNTLTLEEDVDFGGRDQVPQRLVSLRGGGRGGGGGGGGGRKKRWRERESVSKSYVTDCCDCVGCIGSGTRALLCV